jgi:hypothetical protein
MWTLLFVFSGCFFILEKNGQNMTSPKHMAFSLDKYFEDTERLPSVQESFLTNLLKIDISDAEC